MDRELSVTEEIEHLEEMLSRAIPEGCGDPQIRDSICNITVRTACSYLALILERITLWELLESAAERGDTRPSAVDESAIRHRIFRNVETTLVELASELVADLNLGGEA